MSPRFVAALLATVALSRGLPAQTEVKIKPDVVYGHKDGMALTFDVLTPAKPNGAAVLALQSGGWYSGWNEPRVVATGVKYLLDKGFTVMIVRHGSAPKYTVPEAVADVRRAVRYVHLNAKELGVDPDRIGVTGGSAGGHLSLVLGTTGDDGDPKAKDPVLRASSRVAAVVSLYPPTDLRGWPTDPPEEIKKHASLKPPLAFDPALAAGISPVIHASKDDAPSLMISGDKDVLVPVENSKNMVAEFKKVGVPTELIVIEGAGHGFSPEQRDKKVQPAMVGWFEKYLTKTTTTQTPKAPTGPPPTAENVPYGTHPRQVLDFYQAKSDKPTPVVFAIHGGGWVNGDKNSYRAVAPKFQAAGISVVAINYRMVTQAVDADIKPPVKWPIEDAARALQFVRSKAKEWNLDKTRIGATGGSAGGCSSLWLLYHDDLADPKSSDPIARESTRLFCAAVDGPQTTLDPKVLREWMPNARYGGHAFGVRTPTNRDGAFQAFFEKREELLPWIKEYSPITHVTKDDPPVFMNFASQKVKPVKGEEQADPTHSALLGLILMEKLKETGVEGIVMYPDHPHEKYMSSADYLIDRLKAK